MSLHFRKVPVPEEWRQNVKRLKVLGGCDRMAEAVIQVRERMLAYRGWEGRI